ncbi:transcriptional repressor [Variovorax sp. OV329]|uniref:transcriptional repressor n=1 Tax=Variovorax sp. OV329 TaxID=1882825 RepID=UPI0008F379D5|nr:transcriptional repressor [Variovorax sp. OV329]SFN27297.1 Ferric uptake regulator family protein [Variovorax sp. OV329]
MTDSSSSDPTANELAQMLRMRLGPDSGRRIGAAHTAVLQVLHEMKGQALPVSEIHQTLAGRGNPIKLSGVYRVLEVLEEAQVVQCQWRTSLGRPLRVFGMAMDALPQPAGHHD